MSKSSHIRSRRVSRLLKSAFSVLFLGFLLMTQAASMGQSMIYENESESNTTCEELACQNSNACHILKRNGSLVTTQEARCICRGQWAGFRCHLQLHLSIVSLQSQTATLELYGALPITTTTHGTKVDKLAELNVAETTVFLWYGNTSDSTCILLQRSPTTSKKIVLKGLIKKQRYVVCVANGLIDSCAFYHENSGFFDNGSLGSHCLRFTTRARDIVPLDIVEIVAVSCSVLVFVLFLSAFIYCHRHTIILQMCLYVLCCCYACRGRSNKDGSSRKSTNRRMRKNMREVSGDVLMPDDRDVSADDNDEFISEEEVECSSVDYEPPPPVHNNTPIIEMQSSVHIPSSFAEELLLDNVCIPVPFLYENSELVKPLYSPQSENFMKLAFIAEDCGADSTCGSELVQIDAEETFGKKTPQHPSQFLQSFSDEMVRESSEVQSWQSYTPEPFEAKQYYSNSEYHFTKHLSQTHRRKRPTSCPSKNSRLLRRLSQPESTTSAQQTEVKRSSHMLSSDCKTFTQVRRSGYFPAYPWEGVDTEPHNDSSPEIEYSDASGDYRYPPTRPNINEDFITREYNLLKPYGRFSYADHGVAYRDPQSVRHARPLSLPSDHSMLLPFPSSPPPINLFSSNYQRSDKFLQPNEFANPFGSNVLFPKSYSSDNRRIQRKNGYRHSFDLRRLESAFGRNLGGVSVDNDSHPLRSSQARNMMGLSSQLGTARGCPRDNGSQDFGSNTLPRSKKPRGLGHHVSFNDGNTKDKKQYQSNTLPRANKSNLPALSPPMRPTQIDILCEAGFFPPLPKRPKSTPPVTNSSNLPTTPSKSSEDSVSISTSGSSSKSSTSKSVKRFMDHIDKSSIFRRKSKRQKSCSRGELQEFLDLQSPLVEERSKDDSFSKLYGKAKPKRPLSFRKQTNKKFIPLSDDNFKCFFREEEPEIVPVDEDGILSDSDHTGQCETNIDSGLSVSSSVNQTNFHSSLSGSISCFADETVNLVTPFNSYDCVEVDLENDTDNDVASLRASSETLRTDHFSENEPCIDYHIQQNYHTYDSASLKHMVNDDMGNALEDDVLL